VKAYFFSLPTDKLHSVLEEYESEYGAKASDYAKYALPRWRTGQTKMSGMVASRLFRLLPRHMPTDAKLSLVKTLWRKYRPTSKKVLLVGTPASEEQVRDCVEQHLKDTVQEYRVPAPLRNRFEWLADGDVQAYERLLHHFLQQDMDLCLRTLHARLPVFFKHIMTSAYEFRKELREVMLLEGHSLTIVFDRQADRDVQWVDSWIPSQERTHLQPESVATGVIILVILAVIFLLRL
jgi:hypothetical protein